MTTPTQPVYNLNEGYEYQAIRAQLRGEKTPPNFAIHRQNSILALCLGIHWNPRAEQNPAEVWVGNKPELLPWGNILTETSHPLPVFIRRQQGGLWFYTGLYQVSDHTNDPAAIRERLQPPTITAISKIIFLKPIPPVP
jgi:hypothetical protein